MLSLGLSPLSGVTLYSSAFPSPHFFLFFFSFPPVCVVHALHCAQTRAPLRNAGLASASANKRTGVVPAGGYQAATTTTISIATHMVSSNKMLIATHIWLSTFNYLLTITSSWWVLTHSKRSKAELLWRYLWSPPNDINLVDIYLYFQ